MQYILFCQCQAEADAEAVLPRIKASQTCLRHVRSLLVLLYCALTEAVVATH